MKTGYRGKSIDMAPVFAPKGTLIAFSTSPGEQAANEDMGRKSIYTGCLLVVSVKVDDGRVNEVVSTLVSRLAQIGGELMSEGILIRGGLTIGNLIHSHDGVIMGQGLIDAYELESKVSRHARIVLSDKLLSLLNYPLQSKKDRYPYHQYFTRFSDGCVGFHQMIIFQVIHNSDIEAAALVADKLDLIRGVIVKGLDAGFQQPEIFQKFQWLMEQHNGLDIQGDNLRFDIMPLNHQIPGHNVHYQYTDDFHARQRAKK